MFDSLQIGDLVLFESILPSWGDQPVSSSLLSSPGAKDPPHSQTSSSEDDEERRLNRAHLLLALHKSCLAGAAVDLGSRPSATAATPSTSSSLHETSGVSTTTAAAEENENAWVWSLGRVVSGAEDSHTVVVEEWDLQKHRPPPSSSNRSTLSRQGNEEDPRVEVVDPPLRWRDVHDALQYSGNVFHQSRLASTRVLDLVESIRLVLSAVMTLTDPIKTTAADAKRGTGAVADGHASLADLEREIQCRVQLAGGASMVVQPVSIVAPDDARMAAALRLCLAAAAVYPMTKVAQKCPQAAQMYNWVRNVQGTPSSFASLPACKTCHERSGAPSTTVVAVPCRCSFLFREPPPDSATRRLVLRSSILHCLGPVDEVHPQWLILRHGALKRMLQRKAIAVCDASKPTTSTTARNAPISCEQSSSPGETNRSSPDGTRDTTTIADLTAKLAAAQIRVQEMEKAEEHRRRHAAIAANDLLRRAVGEAHEIVRRSLLDQSRSMNQLVHHFHQELRRVLEDKRAACQAHLLREEEWARRMLEEQKLSTISRQAVLDRTRSTLLYVEQQHFRESTRLREAWSESSTALLLHCQEAIWNAGMDIVEARCERDLCTERFVQVAALLKQQSMVRSIAQDRCDGLERELAALRESHEATIQQLTSSNGELMSELQHTTEKARKQDEEYEQLIEIATGLEDELEKRLKESGNKERRRIVRSLLRLPAERGSAESLAGTPSMMNGAPANRRIDFTIDENDEGGHDHGQEHNDHNGGYDDFDHKWGPPIAGIPRVESQPDGFLSTGPNTPTVPATPGRFLSVLQGVGEDFTMDPADGALYCVQAREYKLVLDSLRVANQRKANVDHEVEELRAELRKVRAQRDSLEEDRNTLESLLEMESSDRNAQLLEVDRLKSELAQQRSEAKLETMYLKQTVESLKSSADLRLERAKHVEVVPEVPVSKDS